MIDICSKCGAEVNTEKEQYFLNEETVCDECHQSEIMKYEFNRDSIKEKVSE